MEILRLFLSPLYFSAAALTALGAGLERGRIPAFLGGLFWAVGTVNSLVEGAALDEILCVTMVLLVISTGFWKQKAVGK